MAYAWGGKEISLKNFQKAIKYFKTPPIYNTSKAKQLLTQPQLSLLDAYEFESVTAKHNNKRTQGSDVNFKEEIIW